MAFNVAKMGQLVIRVFDTKHSNATMTTSTVASFVADICRSKKTSLADISQALTHLEQIGVIKMVGKDRDGKWLWQKS